MSEPVTTLDPTAWLDGYHQALEDAAKECDRISNSKDWDRQGGKVAGACAAAIRNMKERGL